MSTFLIGFIFQFIISSSERKTDGQCSNAGGIGQGSTRPEVISCPQYRNCCGICKGQKTELWKEPPEPLLDEIAELVLKENLYWEGSATELASLVKVEIQPHVITRKLNVLAGRLYAEHGIYFRSERTHEGRKLRFWKDITDKV